MIHNINNTNNFIYKIQISIYSQNTVSVSENIQYFIMKLLKQSCIE